MTEPLKPRIDFDGPLEVDQNPKPGAQTLTKIRRFARPPSLEAQRRGC